MSTRWQPARALAQRTKRKGAGYVAVHEAADRRRRCSGFTLIEVLVAMTILAVGVGALVSASAASAFRADFLRDREMARWLAANRMTELQVLPAWPDVGTTNLETEMVSRTWQVRTVTRKVADKDLRRVDVEVRLDKEAKAYIYSVAGFVSNPEARIGGSLDPDDGTGGQVSQ